mgnify:CR=1 FL=1
MSSSNEGKQTGKPPQRTLVQLFIIWNLVALSIWVVTPPGQLRAALLCVVEPYMMITGLCQNFWVFSPDVNTASADLVADVKLSNGKTVSWQYPRNADISLVEKPFKERYREYLTAVLMPSNRYILPSTAAQIARQVGLQNPHSSPTEVVLKVVWRAVPLPGVSEPPQSGTTEFFRARVVPQ